MGFKDSPRKTATNKNVLTPGKIFISDSFTLKLEVFLSDRIKLGYCESDSGFENVKKSVLSLNHGIFPGSEIYD